MVSLIAEGKRIYGKFTKDEVAIYTVQASFFVVLSFFPFIILLLILIQFTPNVSKSDLMITTMAIMPDMLDSFVVGIINNLYTKSPATIVSITAVTALWSASRGMLSIRRGLSRVNKISRKRNYIVRRVIYARYTVVFIFTCVDSLIFLVLGNSLQRLIGRSSPLIGEVISFIVSSRSVAAVAILIVAFMTLCAYLPNTNQKLRNRVPGALFSAAGQTIFSYLFSMYFNRLNNFSYTYGSLTAIVLLMPWLYIYICIPLIGAEINYHYVKDHQQWEVEIS